MIAVLFLITALATSQTVWQCNDDPYPFVPTSITMQNIDGLATLVLTGTHTGTADVTSGLVGNSLLEFNFIGWTTASKRDNVDICNDPKVTGCPIKAGSTATLKIQGDQAPRNGKYHLNWESKLLGKPWGCEETFINYP